MRARNASGFHATITSNKDSYSAGSTAIFAVKYTIDRGAFQEGDTVTVNIPTDVASKVRFSVDPLHFSSAVDKGDGTWELTFGPNAEAALVGSFSMFITTAQVTEETTSPVSVGGDSKDLTVIPGGSADGVGTYTDTIMKDANDNKVSYGDYDYSEGLGDDAAQIGVYDSTNDEVIGYRLFVNNKRATMDNVSVVDTLPDGMSFDRTQGVRVTTAAGDELDPSRYSVSISGQNLTFTHPGTLTDTVWIYYWVKAKGGTGVKYTNRAEISYRSGGKNYLEHRNYVLQGNDYNAASGEKSVDKTIVSSDPADQRVTYTIKFWNSNGFDVGAINLTDKLDAHVRFLYADPGDKFTARYDEASHSVLISNTSPISGSETEYVRFVVDFSDVPEGYTVENTVGGNTTKTLKMPTVKLGATKTVNGQTPGADQTFTFQLRDAQGTVLQEKQNTGETVSFDELVYSEDDLAADGGDSIVRYTVEEKAGDNNAYTYDSTVYNVAVTLHRETGADGRTTVTATPAITKAGTSVDAMTFDNTSNTTSVSVSKVWVDDNDRDGVRPGVVSVQLLADGQPVGDPVEVSADGQWVHTWSGLALKKDGKEIVYSVAEVGVPAGYSVAVSGDAVAGFTVTNTHVPQTVSVPVSKSWVGPVGGDVVVHLLADGADSGRSVTLTAAGGWAGSFEGLPKFRDGGVEIVYSVAEDPVAGYEAKVSGDAVSGFTVTNTSSETVSVSGSKTWVDDNDRDGVRPDSIIVNLLADGSSTGVLKTVTVGDNWSWQFDGLAKFAADGHEIAYSVSENAVPNYTTVVDGTNITNTHVPQTTSVAVTKKWIGGEAGPVVIRLLADGDDSGRTLTLDAAGGWAGSFESLPKFRDGGVEIVYSVAEEPVTGYTAAVSGDPETGFTVTNTKDETPPAPGGSKPSVLPRTGGDSSHPGAALNLLLVGAAALAFVGARRRHRA